MDIILDKNRILPVLAKIQGITGRSTTIAATNNVRIEARSIPIGAGEEFPDLEQGELLITATDLEVGYMGSFPSTVRTPGTIMIDSRKLYEIVKAFPSEEISVSVQQPGWCEISSSTVQYQIVCSGADDFPEPPFVESVEFFKIGPYSLMDTVRKNLMIPYDASDPRTHTHSCHLSMYGRESGDKVMAAASTNGSCMGLFEITFPEATEVYCPAKNEVIPKKRLKELLKFLDGEYDLESAGRVSMGFKPGFMVVRKQNETLSIRMTEAEFPDYFQIFASTEGNTFVADNVKLKSLLKRVSILNDSAYQSAEFVFDKDQLKVKVTNPHIGEASETMPVTYIGEPFRAHFNPKLWLDLLAGIDTAHVIGRLISNERPCIITGDTDRAFTAAVMPMRG